MLRKCFTNTTELNADLGMTKASLVVFVYCAMRVSFPELGESLWSQRKSPRSQRETGIAPSSYHPSILPLDRQSPTSNFCSCRWCALPRLAPFQHLLRRHHLWLKSPFRAPGLLSQWSVRSSSQGPEPQVGCGSYV